jgi:hypothetical protein
MTTPIEMTEMTTLVHAGTRLGAWITELLRTSRMPIPEVRRAALLESVRACESDMQLLDTFLEALAGSPYMPDFIKQTVMTIAIEGRWNELPAAVLSDVSNYEDAFLQDDNDDEEVILDSNHQVQFLPLRSMATAIFTKSRKIKTLPLARRRQLGAAILSTTTKDELMELMLQSLEVAVSLDQTARILIADDVLEERYYRLLLPDRFDCEEVPRQQAEGILPLPTAAVPSTEISVIQYDDECPICLDVCCTDSITLNCSHMFCRECIVGWSQQQQQHYALTNDQGCSVSCPLCRSVHQPSHHNQEQESLSPSPSETTTTGRSSFWLGWSIRNIAAEQAPS